ncbi:hypothetical protein K438DRAFT_1863854 [Mycena galopus ATCC 62051]|nr:hypothetical protein K438DRAFT_1863854 [Mycena galopus ATCC 62051]
MIDAECTSILHLDNMGGFDYFGSSGQEFDLSTSPVKSTWTAETLECSLPQAADDTVLQYCAVVQPGFANTEADVDFFMPEEPESKNTVTWTNENAAVLTFLESNDLQYWSTRPESTTAPDVVLSDFFRDPRSVLELPVHSSGTRSKTRMFLGLKKVKGLKLRAHFKAFEFFPTGSTLSRSETQYLSVVCTSPRCGRSLVQRVTTGGTASSTTLGQRSMPAPTHRIPPAG